MGQGRMAYLPSSYSINVCCQWNPSWEQRIRRDSIHSHRETSRQENPRMSEKRKRIVSVIQKRKSMTKEWRILTPFSRGKKKKKRTSMGPAADPSKWEYNLFNSDLNFFAAPLFGSTTAAWKLTGRPYLKIRNWISSRHVQTLMRAINYLVLK